MVTAGLDGDIAAEVAIAGQGGVVLHGDGGGTEGAGDFQRASGNSGRARVGVREPESVSLPSPCFVNEPTLDGKSATDRLRVVLNPLVSITLPPFAK